MPAPAGRETLALRSGRWVHSRPRCRRGLGAGCPPSAPLRRGAASAGPDGPRGAQERGARPGGLSAKRPQRSQVTLCELSASPGARPLGRAGAAQDAPYRYNRINNEADRLPRQLEPRLGLCPWSQEASEAAPPSLKRRFSSVWECHLS